MLPEGSNTIYPYSPRMNSFHGPDGGYQGKNYVR